MSPPVEVVVLGSGFAGSLIAMALRQRGREVLLIERFRHPRFVIGESTTPLTNLFLEEFAQTYDLPELRPLVKWGSWVREVPGVAVGLKRGFSFYHHQWDQPFQDSASHEAQLLVAASPHDEIADTHWYRPDFDHHLVRLAIARGVSYVDQTEVLSFAWTEGLGELRTQRGAETHIVRTQLVIDATGSRGCLFKLLACGETSFPGYPRTDTLFAHFRGVGRVEELPEFCSDGRPPYPPDDAALHHVFPGGWIWVLRFNNGITSAGAALDRDLTGAIRGADGRPSWERLLQRLPSVQRQFRDAQPVTSWQWQRTLPFLCTRCHGPGWAMLPSAMGFVDPLLSTGFPLVLLGMRRVLGVIEERWGTPGLDEALGQAIERSRTELHRVAQLVGTLYGAMSDFPRFVIWSRLYFAAVSYAESARRLGKRELAGGAFLLGDDARFVREVEEVMRVGAKLPLAELEARVDRIIAPIDVAGLSRRGRRNWLPVDAEDLLNSAAKLGVDRTAIEVMLQRSGFYPPVTC